MAGVSRAKVEEAFSILQEGPQISSELEKRLRTTRTTVRVIVDTLVAEGRIVRRKCINKACRKGFYCYFLPEHADKVDAKCEELKLVGSRNLWATDFSRRSPQDVYP